MDVKELKDYFDSNWQVISQNNYSPSKPLLLYTKELFEILSSEVQLYT